jgi:hypothetical protein
MPTRLLPFSTGRIQKALIARSLCTGRIQKALIARSLCTGRIQKALNPRSLYADAAVDCLLERLGRLLMFIFVKLCISLYSSVH